MEEVINNKIEEARAILKDLGLPEQQQNRICALTLLALAHLKPADRWEDAYKSNMTVSKDIMDFVNENYNADYKPNSRESFRKIALRPFVENNIVILNPDNPTLRPSSSKTHYALSDLTVGTIRKYKSVDWQAAIESFKKNQFPENIETRSLLRKISIYNFKSLLKTEISLGRFNVFIGANGSGKSNILEAIAAVGAAKAGDITFEGLYSRGVRIARPDLMTSSFLGINKDENIDFDLQFEKNNEIEVLSSSLFPKDKNDIYTEWFDKGTAGDIYPADIMNAVKVLVEEFGREKISSLTQQEISFQIDQIIKRHGFKSIVSENIVLKELVSDYCIYDLNTKSLRGITPVDSRRTPLGINGEGLDLLISNFNAFEKEFLADTTKELFDWIEKIQNEKDEKVKAEGLKAGRSTSTLYFTDRYMQKQNNTLSAESSNEGILHVLFYIALFISTKTPALFAIDNIEAALNPKLCWKLIALLTKLSKQRGKQVLITTHNPAILDGLNLLDDEQRLFEVSRDSRGRTKVQRIKFKSDLSDKKFKLSEMWLKGLLGAIPENF